MFPLPLEPARATVSVTGVVGCTVMEVMGKLRSQSEDRTPSAYTCPLPIHMHLQAGGMQGGALGQVRGPDPAIRSYIRREGLEPLGDATKATDATQMEGKVLLLRPALPQWTLSCTEA